MNIKAIWLDKFQELLWEHHTCDWKEGNSNPNYPFQLAVAYFDWVMTTSMAEWGVTVCTVPERTPEEAFAEYLKGCSVFNVEEGK